MVPTPAEVYAFFDVDEMLIDSRRTEPVGGGRPVATDSQGRICGYLNRRQERWLAFWRAHTTVIPTTARSTDAYHRLDLGFTGWAILSFGGIILTPEGVADPRWLEVISEQAARTKDVLHHLHQLVVKMDEQEKIGLRPNIITDGGMDLYSAVKHEQRDGRALVPVHEMLKENLPAGWRLHFNLNLLSILPPFLGKELGVEWFLAHVAPPGVLTLGAGDSLTDVPFMSMCDLSLFPRNSQNARRLAKEVTSATFSR